MQRVWKGHCVLLKGKVAPSHVIIHRHSEHVRTQENLSTQYELCARAHTYTHTQAHSQTKTDDTKNLSHYSDTMQYIRTYVDSVEAKSVSFRSLLIFSRA